MSHEERVRNVDVIDLGASYSSLFRQIGRVNEQRRIYNKLISPTPGVEFEIDRHEI